jgi:hypothetical protein
MNAHSLKRIAAAALVVAVADSAAFAGGKACTNSCVTMAVPRSDGVHTRLDGTADAALWPPTHELRQIRVAALNDGGKSCNVTIDDVLQDEAPGVTGGGGTIDDAVHCDNEGEESTVELRSDRDDTGNGRFYKISFHLEDPDCSNATKTDEVVIVVPLGRSTATSLEAAVDHSPLTASYASSSLQCAPPQRDARLR